MNFGDIANIKVSETFDKARVAITLSAFFEYLEWYSCEFDYELLPVEAQKAFLTGLAYVNGASSIINSESYNPNDRYKALLRYMNKKGLKVRFSALNEFNLLLEASKECGNIQLKIEAVRLFKDVTSIHDVESIINSAFKFIKKELSLFQNHHKNSRRVTKSKRDDIPVGNVADRKVVERKMAVFNLATVYRGKVVTKFDLEWDSK